MSAAGALRWPWRLEQRLFAVDLRSLATFRIGLALVVLFDLATRARDLRAHYSDDGVLPRAALLLLLPQSPISLNMVSGETWFQAFLFLATAACAVALLVGYRTRLATAATWLLIASLQARNPLVLHSGDDVLRLLLFWSLFLPLGALASCDRVLDRSGEALPERVVSAGTVGLLLQVGSIYFFTGLLKTGPDWRSDGTAVENALRVSSFAKPLGHLLLSFSVLLRPLTRALRWLEIFGPSLLFVPFATGAFRMAMIVLFCLFQLGLGLCLALGGFPWVMSVAMLPFVPTGFWHWMAPRGGSAAAARASRAAHAALNLVERLWPRSRLLTSRSIRWRLGRTGQLVGGALAVYVLLSNLGSIGSRLRVPAALTWIGTALQIDQAWVMFTPVPTRLDGWFIFPGSLVDGTAVDVFRGRPVVWTRPPLVYATYRNTRWRKYLLNLCDDRFTAMRPLMTGYLCRAWNRNHREFRRLIRVEAYFMFDSILPGIGPGDPERIKLAELPCLPG